jgi:hypothetical protein
MVMATDFGVGQVLWSMIWFAMIFIWIWLLISVFSDIFRSHDLSGWAKAIWSIFIIFLPYLGVFVYLIARGGKMHEHAVEAAQQVDAAQRAYIKDTVDHRSPADEVARLAKLRDEGVINEQEFQQAKARALA